MKTKEDIRKTLLTQRRAITAETREQAAEAASRLLVAHSLFNTSQHIACYLGQADEFDCTPIIQAIWQAGKNCYLPIIISLKNTLAFSAYHENDLLKLNKYSIREPIVNNKIIAPEKLDLVIVPLVGFDLHGHRIGMGGGYYDRTFAFKNKTSLVIKPYLVGLAYELQKSSEIPHDNWDVSLQSIITERKIYPQ